MKKSNKEQIGFILYFSSRGPFVITTFVILIPLVMDLCKFHRGDNGKISFFGIPLEISHFMFIINSIVCLLNFLVCPILGAIYDYSPHRKNYMIYTAIFFIASIFFSIFLFIKSLWWLSGIIQIASLLFFECNFVLATANISQIAKSRNNRSYLSSFSIISENFSIVLFLIVLSLVLPLENPSNLIARGNFNYYKSHESWRIDAEDVLGTQCQKEYDLKLGTLGCARKYSPEQAMNILEVSVPAGEKVTLSQTKEITSVINGKFQFSATMASSNPSSLQLIVTEYDGKNNALNNDSNQSASTIAMNELYQFVKKDFKMMENAKRIDFRLQITSDVDTIVYIKRIETVISLEAMHLLILIISGIWFFSIAMYSYTLLKDRGSVLQSDPRQNIILLGVKQIWNSLCHCFSNSRAFIFILLDMFWVGGYSMLSMITLLHLQDDMGANSSHMAIVILSMTIFSIIGAYFRHFFEERYFTQWGMAVGLYCSWITFPFMIYFLSVNIPFYIFMILPLIFGISLGAVLSLRYSIFSNLIPENHEGEYMSLLFLSSKIMHFFVNFIMLFLLHWMRLRSTILITSIFFVIAFAIALAVYLTDQKKEKLRINAENVAQESPVEASV